MHRPDYDHAFNCDQNPAKDEKPFHPPVARPDCRRNADFPDKTALIIGRWTAGKVKEIGEHPGVSTIAKRKKNGRRPDILHDSSGTLYRPR
jgi:hypothetical protein